MTHAPSPRAAAARPSLRSSAAIALLAVVAIHSPPAHAGLPDVSNSFFVPQVGSVAAPTEGATAIRNFRTCPNMDGGSSLPNNARIKIVLRDVNGNPVSDVPAQDICVLFNGGTPAQTFSGIGADSVIANSLWNQDPLCPDVRCLMADAPTDATGTTYITFLGSAPGSPGVAQRDPNRKWGHYDSELPVYASGFKLEGRLTSASANGTYVLRIKNLDVAEGLGPDLNEGEAVTAADLNMVVRHIGVVSPISYWVDFNGDGLVNILDVNLMLAHLNHDCDTPLNP